MQQAPAGSKKDEDSPDDRGLMTGECRAAEGQPIPMAAHVDFQETTASWAEILRTRGLMTELGSAVGQAART
jgi:hypothetical protein